MNQKGTVQNAGTATVPANMGGSSYKRLTFNCLKPLLLQATKSHMYYAVSKMKTTTCNTMA